MQRVRMVGDSGTSAGIAELPVPCYQETSNTCYRGGRGDFMRMSLWSIFGLVFAVSAAHAGLEEVRLKTPRGESVPLNLHFPEGVSKAPVILMAPGGGYHKDLPIFTEVAKKAAQSGIAAIRFNWAYCKFDSTVKKCTGAWSDDLGAESEDLRVVIEYAKSNPRLDSSKIFVAGKSLGTLVSYPIFKQDASLKALFLLTPLCTETDDDGRNPKPVGERNYPGFAELTRPVLFLLGNADPACSVPMLYDFARATNGNTSIVVVGGNHSLNFGRDEEGFAERNAANVSAAAGMIVHWMSLLLER